jgi:hypothetical protein
MDTPVTVPFAPDYMVSRDGTVWSKHRRKPIGHVNERGYIQMQLTIGGAKRKFLAHQIVCRVFKPIECHKGLHIRHLDGNPANNAIDNLAWGTPKENSADSVKHGVIRHGEQVFCAKLSVPKVKAIRLLHAYGCQSIRIARIFNVSDVTIHDVIHRKRWKHV